jgi:hypothetical protein
VEGGWVPSGVHCEVLGDVGGGVADAAEFCGGRAGPKGNAEEEVGNVVNDCDTCDCGCHVGVEPSIGSIHVSFIDPNDFVWVSAANVVDAV